MRIVLISDTHKQHRKLKLPDGEMVIHAGDVSGMGSVNEVEDFLDWFGKLPHKYKIFVAGNHDFCFERNELGASDMPDGIIYLQDKVCEIEGLKIYGSPYSPEFYNWAFMKRRGVELRKVWELVPEKLDILITHCPPFTILDQTAYGRFEGCEELFMRVKKIKPKVHVFGHIHEAYGTKEEFGVKFINASVLDQEYQLVNNPVVINL